MQIKYNGLFVVCETKSHKFKVYIMGQADGHIMDWRGCNHKFVSVTGQPMRGFETVESAKMFCKNLESSPKRRSEEVERAKKMVGMYISDERMVL